MIVLHSFKVRKQSLYTETGAHRSVQKIYSHPRFAKTKTRLNKSPHKYLNFSTCQLSKVLLIALSIARNFIFRKCVADRTRGTIMNDLWGTIPACHNNKHSFADPLIIRNSCRCRGTRWNSLVKIQPRNYAEFIMEFILQRYAIR